VERSQSLARIEFCTQCTSQNVVVTRSEMIPAPRSSNFSQSHSVPVRPPSMPTPTVIPLQPRELRHYWPMDRAPHYRRDLALVHHLGFGFHADACAPGILKLLEPVLERRGLVLELGCGSGLLTRHLVEAGHRVIATDASPAMLDLAREVASDAESIRRLTLPDDPLPEVDAIVSVGHVLSYLPDESGIDRALAAIAEALRPGGVLAIDLCDIEWGAARHEAPNYSRIQEDWAIITVFSVPLPTRFVREITTFVRNEDGSWRRDDERHENVLIDTKRVPGLLANHRVEAVVTESFGAEQLPVGLKTVIGRKDLQLMGN
jgi:SAM-dependent methyltransferase